MSGEVEFTRRRTGERRYLAAAGRNALPHSQEELQAALEELHKAHEALSAQNEELIRTRQAIEAECQRYQELFDFAPYGYLVTDRTGMIREANQAAAKMLGVEPGFLCKKPLSRYVAHRDKRIFRSLLSGIEEDTSFVTSMDLLMQPRVGDRFVAAISVSPIRKLSGSATGMRWLLRDVTQIRSMASALRDSEERLRLMTDSLPVLISYVDAEQRYQFNNAMYESWFGIPKDSLKGRHVREVIGPEAYQSVREHIEAALRGEARTFEGRVPYQRAGLRSVRIDYIPEKDNQGETLGFYALVTDLTDRRETEDALQEERDFVSTLLQTSSALIVVLDGEGNVIRFNRASEELAGYRFEELMGKPIWRLVPADQREDVKGVWEALRTGESHNTFENDWVTKNWARRRIAWSNTAVHDGEGVLKYVVSTGIDITARQMVETELRQSREELRSLSARLLAAEEDERRRLSRELHDSVNQSLGMLAVEAELLMEKTAPSSDLRRELVGCRNRILELSENVRRLAYELHPAILDDLGLEVALRSYVDDFTRRTGVRVTLTTRNVPLSLPKGIASCFYRIAQESLANAAKHSRSTRITVRLAACHSGYWLMIRDFGRGFDAETVKDHRRGLGLVSMEERARLEGGRLDLRTGPGQGTHIRVWLPLQGNRS
jgi:PAS domain S-box-containing protein